jgi:hypothetical protein
LLNPSPEVPKKGLVESALFVPVVTASSVVLVTELHGHALVHTTREKIETDFDTMSERMVKVAYDRLNCCGWIALSTNVCLVVAFSPP